MASNDLDQIQFNRTRFTHRGVIDPDTPLRHRILAIRISEAPNPIGRRLLHYGVFVRRVLDLSIRCAYFGANRTRVVVVKGGGRVILRAVSRLMLAAVFTVSASTVVLA